MTLSTHVLDATTGTPAAGLRVTVDRHVGGRWERTGDARTDHDGRVPEFPAPVEGVHRITFDTGGYFGERQVETFYPEVVVTFRVTDASAHHHVPLLMSPFAFSTYRGS